MKKFFLFTFLFSSLLSLHAQNTCTPTSIYNFSNNADDMYGNSDGILLGNATANNVLSVGYSTSDYLKLPSSTLNGLTDFTISFKINFNAFNTTGTSPTNHILSGSNASNSDAFAFAYQKSIEKFVVAINSSIYTFPIVFNTNTWYCFTLIRQGSQLKFYADGELVSSQQCVTSAINITQNTLFIGQEQDCNGGCFALNQCMNGLMDDLVLYNCANLTNLRCSNILAVNEAPDKVNFEIYPNPANQSVIVKTDQAEKITQINLMSMTGQVIEIPNFEMNLDKFSVSTEALPDGIYFIVLRFENSATVSKKLLVKHD